MLFNEALDALIEGKYVARSVWSDGSYLIYLPGMMSVFKVIIEPSTNVGNYLWTVADFKADDWQIYSRREDVPGAVQL